MTTTRVNKVLLKRGNTAQNNAYTGVYGELSIDMEANALRIHDGVLAGGNVVSGSGGTGSYANANVKSYLTSFNGNILPSANVTYSLGSSTHQWKDLWVSNNTIYINSIPLSINTNGNLTINGNEIAQGPQGIQGETGPQGPRGNIGPQGPQGNVGPTGATGAQGPQGIQGNIGSQGPQGIQGNTGPAGAQGIQGIQGNIGPQGSTGPQGIQGNVGPQGSQGIQGIQGNVGEQGPRGFTGNVGEQGPQGERGLTGNTGAQGVSVTLLGSIDIVANLPMTANAGEGWIVQADGDLYLWNTISSTWNNIGQIVGPQGDPGPEGPRGFTGNVGAEGPQGNIGPQGPQGEQGIQGNVGAQGAQGIQGNVGAQGDPGPQGEQGIQGNVGPQGERGLQGNVGPQGATGPTGPQGIQGNAGVNGTNGNDGIGISTATVTSGNLIITLSDATIVDAGNVVGPQGPQGNTGAPGTSLTGWTIDAFNSLVPNTDILQDIGTPQNRVRHLYVGPGSIQIGDSIISESVTGKLVLPGVTRATTLFADEVEDDDDQIYQFSSVPTVIDAYEYSVRSGSVTPPVEYVAAEYIVSRLDDDSYLENIDVDVSGTWTQAIATTNRNASMYAYIGSDINESFNPSNWVNIPFRVRAKANDTEYEFSSGSSDRLVNEPYELVLDDSGHINLPGGSIRQQADENLVIRVKDADDDGYRLDLIVVDDNDDTLTRVEVHRDGVEILTNFLSGDAHGWYFRDNGNLQLPAGGDIVDSNGQSVLGGGSSTHIEYTDEESNYTSTVDLTYDFKVDVDNAHLDINGNGTWEIGSTNFDTMIFVDSLGGPNPDNIIIKANDNDWTFANDGNLTLPEGGDILDSNGASVLGSVSDTFKTLVVDGQDSLVASGNDSVEIVAGIGVTLTTRNTAPKSITISADSLVNLDGGVASTVFDTPVLYAEGGGAGTRFGVNSPSFDGEDITPGTIDFNLNGGRA